MPPRTIDLKCHRCQMQFCKRIGEYNRRIKQGHTEFFCSISCGTAHVNSFTRRCNIDNLVANNRRRDITPFRWFMGRVRYRAARKGSSDLTPEYLKELWESQSGRCPFTGEIMILPNDTDGWCDGKNPQNASLDRIDNTKGYIVGNVRFVSLMANLARCTFTDEQVFTFCRAVTEYNKQ